MKMITLDHQNNYMG